MNAHDRTTLRRIREAVEKGDPDHWFITPGLSNKAALLALQAVEEVLAEAEGNERAYDQLNHQWATALDERDRYRTKLNQLEAAVEKMAPLAKVEELEKEITDWETSFDLYYKATAALRHAWLAVHPDQHHVMPDTAKMCEWAAEELKRLSPHPYQPDHNGECTICDELEDDPRHA